jgi:hypothetical protein
MIYYLDSENPTHNRLSTVYNIFKYKEYAMAVHNGENGQNNGGQKPNAAAANGGAAQTSNQSQTQQPNFGGGMSRGFGFAVGSNGFLMQSNQGSEYTLTLAKAVLEVYKTLPSANKPKISIFDKEKLTNLAFSALAISYEASNTVNYFIVLLEATGRAPMKASSIMDELIQASKTPNTKPLIYTTDDAVDGVLHNEVIKALSAEYQGEREFKSVDGMIIPNTVQQVESIANVVAAIAFNAVTVEAEIAGGFKDLNISNARAGSKSSVLRIESNMNGAQTVNEVGSPVRADFKLELVVADQNAGLESLNLQNGRNVLTKTSGYIDAVPIMVDIPTMPGTPVVRQLRFRPNIVITSNVAQAPTTGFALLGLVTSLVMVNPNMHLGSLMPKNAMHNAGALNIMANVENNQQGGSMIDLASKKYTSDKVIAFLKQLFSLEPVVSMDIDVFGPQTSYNGIFSAASSGSGEHRTAAAQELVRAANWLTNGNFPADFPINEIFQHDSIVVPVGKWADKSGERDIRDVDLTMIAGQSGDMEMMNKYALSNLPASATGLDPYITKVDIISKIIPDAEITNKAIRVTFSAKFISTLVQAASVAGLDPRFEPEVHFAESNNINMLAGYYDGAGINVSASQFAREAFNQGNKFVNPYMPQFNNYRY